MADGAAPFADRFAAQEGAYLNAASHGPLPLAASRAGREALLLKERPHRITSATYVAAVAEVRALAARLLGAREESVALVTGAGQVVNAVARGLELGGGRIDPGPVVEAARRAGATTVVDGSQAAGALPFDFEASGVDVYAASGYKFLLGPYGTGIGLFSAAALERVAVTDVSWWS